MKEGVFLKGRNEFGIDLIKNFDGDATLIDKIFE